jgi:hypothetical protein
MNTQNTTPSPADRAEIAAFLERIFSKPPTCPYSRKQALADGLQMQLSPKYLRKIRELWDMDIPRRLFFTKKAIESLELTDRRSRRDLHGRLFDLLNLLNDAIGNSPWGRGSPPLTRVSLVVVLGPRKTVPLFLAWSTVAFDDPRSALTLMLQEEDPTPCDPDNPYHSRHKFPLW